MGSDDQRYQQGHPKYRKSVMDAMAFKGGTDTLAADALQNPQASFEYIEIRQPIRNDGSLGELRIAHYDQTI